MKKVYLIGYMGCGKSAIGKRLSFADENAIYDMDTEIEKKMGMTIRKFLKSMVKSIFVKLETEFLRTFRDEILYHCNRWRSANAKRK